MTQYSSMLVNTRKMLAKLKRQKKKEKEERRMEEEEKKKRKAIGKKIIKKIK